MILAPAEYMQRRVRSLLNRISVLSYGNHTTPAGLRRKAQLNAAFNELIPLQKSLKKELARIRTLGPNNSPRAKALREIILRRRAMNVIKRHWYKPVTGRGYARHVTRRASSVWSN
jgi:hypothetical protein